MYTEIHYPINRIPAENLDEYLANGWFRMGQTIFTCWFLFMEKGFFSAIWIRQDLQGFKFKKRSRKLMNRNAKLFTYQIGPARIDLKKEKLYKKHRVRFKTGVHRTLNQSLMSGANFSIYDTRQIEVYLGDELVAASAVSCSQCRARVGHQCRAAGAWAHNSKEGVDPNSKGV